MRGFRQSFPKLVPPLRCVPTKQPTFWVFLRCCINGRPNSFEKIVLFFVSWAFLVIGFQGFRLWFPFPKVNSNFFACRENVMEITVTGHFLPLTPLNFQFPNWKSLLGFDVRRYGKYMDGDEGANHIIASTDEPISGTTKFCGFTGT